MKITEITLCVTLNGLRYFMFFSIVLQIPTYRKTQRKQHDNFRTRISIVLISWGPPMLMVFPLKSQTELNEKAPEEKRVSP